MNTMTMTRDIPNEDTTGNEDEILVSLTLHEGQMLGAFKLILRGPVEDNPTEFPLNGTMAYFKRGTSDADSGVWMGNIYGDDTGEICTEFCDTVRSLVETVGKLYARDVAIDAVDNAVNEYARYVRNNSLVQLLPIRTVRAMLDDTRRFEEKTHLISRATDALHRREWGNN
jgi:hypothetical protein